MQQSFLLAAEQRICSQTEHCPLPAVSLAAGEDLPAGTWPMVQVFEAVALKPEVQVYSKSPTLKMLLQ